METKLFTVDVRAKPKPGTFKARVCTFDIVDKGNDVVHRGAFTASLARRRASNRAWPVIFDHDSSDPMMVVGRVSPHDSQEDDTGLVVTGMLNLEEERGFKVYEELKRGTLEWSFGCFVQKAQPRAQGIGRDLLVLDLFEVSPTLIGKGDTETLMVASADTTSRRLTVAQTLAPYAARMLVLRARLEGARRAG